ncbi:MAG: DUF459 domain-containing protein [Alphaproteobacteria bacterium]|nr:DUF459 domain-containing protein [Alphaproteobacteria bacterium]MCW5744254.1 DUF459 domain-containing protein [Alphaproteobacteria bacterium]
MKVILTRRRALSLAGLLALAGAIPALAQTASAPPADPLPALPLNLVVVGDSLGQGVWGSLYWRFYATREVRVINATKASTGFNRTPYEDLLDIGDGQSAQLAVMMTGANDAQNAWPLQEGGAVGVFGTAAWAQLYRQRMDRFFDAAIARGTTVIWIGMPIMRDPGFERRMALVREAQRDACAARGVTYLDLVPPSVDEAGGYTEIKRDDKGRTRTFRGDDGVHLTVYGSEWVAEIVLFALLDQKPSWLDPAREKLVRTALG